MKKFFMLMAIMVCLLCAAFAFVACNPNSDNGGTTGGGSQTEQPGGGTTGGTGGETNPGEENDV